MCGVAGAPVSFLWRGHISQVNCMSEESVSNVSGVSNPAEVFFFVFFLLSVFCVCVFIFCVRMLTYECECTLGLVAGLVVVGASIVAGCC